MGGDLNLKKSWHVGLLSNQTKVWQAEQKALEERKKIQQIQAERKEEAAIEELQRLQAASGGSAPAINPKVAWMYSGSNSGPGETTESQEAYLLGKRTVHSLLAKNDEATNVAKPNGGDAFVAPSAREITVKANLDPLLAIERQKLASAQKMLDDPALKARLLKQIRREEKEKEKKSGKHRRDDGEDRSHRSKRRRHTDDSRGYEKKHRSPRRRSRSDSGSRSRSHSGARDSRRHGEAYSRGRHGSRYDYDDRRHSYARSRSRSLPRRDREDEKRRYRSRSADYSRQRTSPIKNARSEYRPRNSKPATAQTASPPDSLKDKDESPTNADAERAIKLAAMQSSATDLEVSRNRRLAEMEARDAAEKEVEDRKRGSENHKFVGSLHRQAAGVGLEGRLKRSKGGLERLDNTF